MKGGTLPKRWRQGREECSRVSEKQMWGSGVAEVREDEVGPRSCTLLVTVAHLVSAFVALLVLMEYAAPARQCTTRR